MSSVSSDSSLAESIVWFSCRNRSVMSAATSPIFDCSSSLSGWANYGTDDSHLVWCVQTF